MAHLSLRIDLQPAGRLGPGKVGLLEAVRDVGSISGAARVMGMSYRRAWVLIEDLNRLFREPLVAAQSGGRAGGGATLTPLGEAIVAHYRAIEQAAERSSAAQLLAIQDAMAGGT